MRRFLPCLKPLHFILPAAALAIVVTWNVVEMRSISSLRSDTASLRKQITAPQQPTSSRARLNDQGGKSGSMAGADPIDWKKMSAVVTAAQNGGDKSQLRGLLDFEQRLAAMSREEMIAALDEIDSLGLSTEDRAAMEELILESLIEQDPQYVLERFAPRIESEPDGIGWQLSNAMNEWAKKDLGSATAWLDRQIAAGTFESKSLDGRSEMRTQFESALMESLIDSEPASAGERLAALPEDQRREVLEQLPFAELSPEAQRAYTALVREMIPPDERAGSFAHIASQLADEGGYEQVTDYLSSVNATPAERAASAKQTAESQLATFASEGEITQAQVDSLSQWLGTQAPGEVGSIVGKSLAEAAQDGEEFGFSEASQLAIDYQKTSGDDDVLVAFLKSYSARSNLEEAVSLAEMITDPQVREQLLRDLK